MEKGHVFFFYRPKVEESEEQQHQITSLNDVAKFYMLLSPLSSSSEDRVHTLLVMTGKMLPRLAQHDRRGAFVDMTSTDLSEIISILGEKEYDTRVTHQHRYSPPARPCGEGLYEIILHGTSPKHTGHTHFIYELEVPSEPG